MNFSSKCDSYSVNLVVVIHYISRIYYKNPKVTVPAPKSEKKGPGRPNKAVTGAEDSAKGTFVADRKIIRKLKFIALVEDCLLKDVIDGGFKTYIEKWEKKNGEIPKPKR